MIERISCVVIDDLEQIKALFIVEWFRSDTGHGQDVSFVSRGL